jgi:hypothetical protein
MTRRILLVALVAVLASATLVSAELKPAEPAKPQAVKTNWCVEVDVESSPQAYINGTMFFSAEITNCGDTPGRVQINGTVQVPGHDPFPFAFRAVYLGAGETFANSWDFDVPFFMPTGTYTLCVTATLGDAQDDDCTSTEILPEP